MRLILVIFFTASLATPVRAASPAPRTSAPDTYCSSDWAARQPDSLRLASPGSSIVVAGVPGFILPEKVSDSAAGTLLLEVVFERPRHSAARRREFTTAHPVDPSSIRFLPPPRPFHIL